jgi:hypothetical protein
MVPTMRPTRVAGDAQKLVAPLRQPLPEGALQAKGCEIA